MSTRLLKLATPILLGVASGLATPAQAYVTYNRLGYISCNACHFDSMGSGTLSPYGRGVGAAMAAWSRDTTPEEKKLYGGLQARVIGFNETPLANPFLMQTDLLGTAFINKQVHVDVTAGLNLQQKQSGFANVPSGADTFVVRRAMVTAELSDTDSLEVGRDFAVQGLNLDDHTAFLKTRNRRNVTDYPTQLRYIRQTDTMQLVPYLALPSYEEADSNREYGLGFRGEYLLNDHNSVGLEALQGNTAQVTRTSVGAFARLSQAHWNGLVAEGLFNHLNSHAANLGFNQENLYIRPFVAVPEWIETSFIYEYLHVDSPFYRSTHQLGPELNIRLHEYLSVLGDGRKIINAGGAETDWSWYGQIFLHVQI